MSSSQIQPNSALGIGHEGRERQGLTSGEPDLAPRRVLWVVVVTTSACLKGEGITLPATRPLMWAMSASRYALTSSHTWAGRDRPQPGEGPGRSAQSCPSSKISTLPLGEWSVPQASTNLSHAGIVNEAGIGAGASYDEPRSEKSSSDCQLVIVNKASFGLDRDKKLKP